MYFEEHITTDSRFPFLVQISSKPAPMLAHRHNRTELMYFYATDGCEYHTHGKMFHVKSEDLLIANPCEIHECLHFGTGAKVCCITIDPSFYHVNTKTLLQNHVQTPLKIRDIFESIDNAMQEKNELTPLFLRGYLSELFAILLRDYPQSLSTRKRTAYLENVEKLTPVFAYIQARLSEPISLKDMADTIRLSESRFYHLFKEICGESPTEYLVHARLEHACKLLAQTKDSVTKIAFDCGFCDSSYFAKIFKKHTHQSPLAYRKKRLQDAQYTALQSL